MFITVANVSVCLLMSLMLSNVINVNEVSPVHTRRIENNM